MRVQRLLALLAGICAMALVTSDGVQADATYSYDELGRIKTVTYADGAQVTYNYDPADNRTQQQKSLASINQLPSAGNDSISVSLGESITFDPLINDSDSEGEPLTIIGVTSPAKGVVSVNSNRTQLQYQSTGSSAGSDNFDYYIQDSSGGVAKATVNVTIQAFTATLQISGSGPVNLRSLADAAGYDGAQDATITFEVGSGVVVTGTAAGGTAIDSGDWPTSSYDIDLTLIIKGNGKVHGGGGAGGNGAGSYGPGENGGDGGDAVYCRLNMAITVETGGEIKSGGGGGEGGTGTISGDPGGGGGGGFPNGPGGSAGGSQAEAGEPGTISGGGAGGEGGHFLGLNYGGDGGDAGQLGEGAYGSFNDGGAAGYAIRKNGHTVNVTNDGTIVGTQG